MTRNTRRVIPSKEREVMKATEQREQTVSKVKYPGTPEAMDGTAALVEMETA